MIKIKAQRTLAVTLTEFYQIHLKQKQTSVSNHYRQLLNVNTLCLKLLNSENLVMVSRSFIINYPYSSTTQHLIVIYHVRFGIQKGMNWERSTSRLHIVTLLTYLCAEYIMQNATLDEAQDGIKIAGRNTNNLRHANSISTYAL